MYPPMYRPINLNYLYIHPSIYPSHLYVYCLVTRPISFDEAPASSIGEIAGAVLRDGCSHPSLQQASRVDKHHSERNAHRLFNRYGLSLKVPMTSLEVSSSEEDPLSIPFLAIPDFASKLLNSYEQTLFGGLKVGPEAESLCSEFWSRYRFTNPQHVIYSQVKESDRRSYIPCLLHGDKGRTLQKSPIFVLSWEVPFGLGPALLSKCAYDNVGYARKQVSDTKLKWSCSHRLSQDSFTRKRKYSDLDWRECPLASNPGCPEGSKFEHGKNSHQRHNSKGHSYLSRWLVAAVPSKVYNRNAQALKTLLKEMADELTQLYTHGLVHQSSNKVFHMALIGVKGDAEFHWEAGEFNRSYHNTGLVNECKMCHQCDAGAAGLSFTDCSDSPQWAATIGRSDPWDALPPLNHAPYATGNPTSLYLFDPFHVLKYGVFRDCIASIVVRLCAMKYFDFEPSDLKGIPFRLERAYSMYRLWALAAGKNPTLKGFTKSNFNFKKYSHFAWVGCKGSEATLLMMWLDSYLGLLLEKPVKEEWHLVPLKAMKQTVQAGLTFTGIMHSHGLWLPRCCSQLLVDSGLSFLRGYNFLATHCMNRKVTGFRLRPKLHYLGHIVYDLQLQLSRGASFTLSPAIALCEQNEDFIGRQSRVSRRVSARTCSVRTTQRYLVKIRLLLEKMFSS